VLERESAWGAVALAERLEGIAVEAAVPVPAMIPVPEATGVSPTELRNSKSMDLDRMPLRRAIRLMLEEESTVPSAILGHTAALERLVRRAVRSLSAGGRLFYVGAGTSGRLGVLDASECPPTFGTPPECVQGIMAGGVKALHSAVEGAEDDAGAGASAIASREVGPADLVVGIAASGRTPFVWGALNSARHRGATTALVSFNPHLKFPRGSGPDVVLAIDVGPEVLTGSTRLKAGTATKLVLNVLTTLTMVRLGKVTGNLMTDLNPSNHKLRGRAVRIVAELTGVDAGRSEAALAGSGWVVKKAVERLGRLRDGARE
jgi:N-acetylmuramic acid 6-phosphate etherase